MSYEVIGFMVIGTSEILCVPCGEPLYQATSARKLYRVNVYPYKQTCHRCKAVMNESIACELFPAKAESPVLAIRADCDSFQPCRDNYACCIHAPTLVGTAEHAIANRAVKLIPTTEVILTGLREIALRQLRTTKEGKALIAAGHETLVVELLECIVRNQANPVADWIDVAVNGE